MFGRTSARESGEARGVPETDADHIGLTATTLRSSLILQIVHLQMCLKRMSDKMPELLSTFPSHRGVRAVGSECINANIKPTRRRAKMCPLPHVRISPSKNARDDVRTGGIVINVRPRPSQQLPSQ